MAQNDPIIATVSSLHFREIKQSWKGLDPPTATITASTLNGKHSKCPSFWNSTREINTILAKDISTFGVLKMALTSWSKICYTVCEGHSKWAIYLSFMLIRLFSNLSHSIGKPKHSLCFFIVVGFSFHLSSTKTFGFVIFCCSFLVVSFFPVKLFTTISCDCLWIIIIFFLNIKSDKGNTSLRQMVIMPSNEH